MDGWVGGCAHAHLVATGRAIVAEGGGGGEGGRGSGGGKGELVQRFERVHGTAQPSAHNGGEGGMRGRHVGGAEEGRAASSGDGVGVGVGVGGARADRHNVHRAHMKRGERGEEE